MRDFITVDIETGPLPDGELSEFAPKFKPPGNYKDPEKIEAKRIEHMDKVREGAALSPLTGRVLAIGFKRSSASDVTILMDEDEASMLREFTDMFSRVTDGTHFVTFNGNTFDWPFIIKRCWRHRIDFPFHRLRNGRYWGSFSVDLREVWGMGDRQASGNLDQVCRMFGLSGKTGSGDQFHSLIQQGLLSEARDYLVNDVLITHDLAKIMIAGDIIRSFR